MSTPPATFEPGNAANLNVLWASLALEEWRRLGVALVVVAPGSLSAPLALAVAAMRGVDATVCHDERAAAFLALGAARAQGRPAVVITTSGTAVANLLPAAIEAAETCTPLILVTADRPPELRDCGANQAIRQESLLRNVARWSFELPCAASEPGPNFVLSCANEAWQRSQGVPSAAGGVVHLNWSFREPLAPTRVEWDRGALASIEHWIGSDEPWRRRSVGIDTGHESRSVLDRIADEARGCVRPVVVVGACHTPQQRELCRRIARSVRCPVIADIASGLRGDASITGCVAHADLIALAEGREALTPDFVLRVGDNLSSRRIGTLIRSWRDRGAALALVRTGPKRFDPDHEATVEIHAALHGDGVGEVRAVAASRQSILACDEVFAQAWRDAECAAADSLTRQLDTREAAVSEPAIARLTAAAATRAGATLSLGNSMPIRDADMHVHSSSSPAVIVASRGASGIDGLVATALGHARAGGRRVVLVLGDLSLLHDIGSLALVRQCPVPLTVVVINNDGGGIFHFLPLAAYHGALDPWSTAPHGHSFGGVGGLFGVQTKALSASATAGEFESALEEALVSTASTLIEVRTDREANQELHRAIQRVVAAAIDASLSGSAPTAKGAHG